MGTIRPKLIKGDPDQVIFPDMKKPGILLTKLVGDKDVAKVVGFRDEIPSTIVEPDYQYYYNYV